MKAQFFSLLITLAFFLLIVFPPNATAATNFTTDYHVTYTVQSNGNTQAKLDVTLTNTTSQFYASSYKMQLGFDELSNVKAADSEGPIKATVTKNSDGYLIGLAFNKKSVGNGSKLPFTITFDTPTVAKQYGKIWEINIPGIANPEDFSNFTVSVVVPPSFGQARYIKPNQPSNNLTFSKDQLGKSGISMAFGSEQLFNFDLSYHLKNDKVYPISTEIALPPTTNYQDVSITEMNPEPVNVTEDEDGNWIAEYRLLPAQKMDILVSGVAQLRLTPKEQELPLTEYNEYLKPQPYWEADKNEIKELAHELRTPQAIYEYVRKTLSYDFSRVTDNQPRLGAMGALQNQKSAVCREFTDLFIAIARASGIPAREVNGYAYTENAKQRPISLTRDILHAWPEYYDKEKKTWIMVDPTWGSTTGGVDYFNVLDFDHFAFAIKGRESNYPIPAGGYKLLSEKDAKDVDVSFAQTAPIIQATDVITADFPKTAIAGLPVVGKVTVKNSGPQEIPPSVLSITSTTLLPTDQIIGTKTIPPFGHQTWDVGFRPTKFLTNEQMQFTLRLGEHEKTHYVTVAPFFMTIWGIGALLLAVLSLSLVIIFFKIRHFKLR